MYKNIVIATDGSELAMKAVVAGLGMAKNLGAKATLMTVTQNWSATQMAELATRGAAHPIEEYEAKAAQWADRVLASAVEKAKELGVPAGKAHCMDRPIAEGIIETAKAQGADLIVMSSHGRGLAGRMLLGSVALKVLTLSTIPVMICR